MQKVNLSFVVSCCWIAAAYFRFRRHGSRRKATYFVNGIKQTGVVDYLMAISTHWVVMLSWETLFPKELLCQVRKSPRHSRQEWALWEDSSDFGETWGRGFKRGCET